MNVFCFNPSANRESLKEFNERVQEFCLEEGAIAVTASAFGKTLVLSVVTVNDDPDTAMGMDTIMPAVLGIDSKDIDTEEQLERLMRREADKATEEEPIRQPVDIRVVQNGHDPMKGWAVCIVVTGEIEVDDGRSDGDSDGEDDGEEDDSSTPRIAHVSEILPPSAQP